MDIFGNVKLVEVPLQITAEQKHWLEMMVKKGKIAVPPGGTLPEGSVISIFMRTLLWNSEEQGQWLEAFPEEVRLGILQPAELVQIQVQISEDQKVWLDRIAAATKVSAPPGETVTSMFIRILLAHAMDQQKALELAESSPAADDDW
jgi:hypothetical protein